MQQYAMEKCFVSVCGSSGAVCLEALIVVQHALYSAL